ncbi:MAG: hypothetical protein NVV66_16480 [Cellulomonas sp.]|nr:hypothetical protein [Cellulomonas sp.]MCR6706212.1 hypothetical protein [Cellulomonas sp.]
MTWKATGGDGTVFERIFKDIDDGYDWYVHRQRSPKSFGATWEHVRD